MEFFISYSLFLAKIITIFLIFGVTFLTLIGFKIRSRQKKGQITIYNLGKQYCNIKREMQFAKMNKIEKNIWEKKNKKKEKDKIKKIKNLIKKNGKNLSDLCLYVIDFKGSIDANEVQSLREEISAILSVAKEGDEVLLRLESPGGVVNGYGLASSQLQRIKNKKIPLTISIDKIAASGGYMMACVANKIISAPFAIIGSIGVVAQIPNFNRLLKQNNIDIELHTSGKYKRTLTLFGQNSQEGREKFKKELNQVHELFKNFVKKMRPIVDIELVSTGEHWYGEKAMQLKLIDSIETSDDFIINYLKTHKIFMIQFNREKHWIQKFTKYMTKKFNHLQNFYI